MGGGAVGQPYRPLAAAGKGQGVLLRVLLSRRGGGKLNGGWSHGDGDPIGDLLVSRTLADEAKHGVSARGWHNGQHERSGRLGTGCHVGFLTAVHCDGAARQHVGHLFFTRVSTHGSHWFSHQRQLQPRVSGRGHELFTGDVHPGSCTLAEK